MISTTDKLHEMGGLEEWSESFYFSFYDHPSGIFAFLRVGLKPNKGEKEMFCFLLMPDGTFIGTKDQAPFDNTDLAAKGLKFSLLEPEKKWNLSFSGRLPRYGAGVPKLEDVAFSVDYQALNPMFNYRECVSGEKEMISSSIASEHLEQYGRLKGQLKIGKTPYAIDGMGERDHSWGVRDWNAAKMWMWINCQFSENLAFNVTKLTVEGGDVDAGYIFMGGRNIPILSVDALTDYDSNGGPAKLSMEMTDKEGKKHRVEAVVLRTATLPFPSRDGKNLSILYEPLAKYTMDGQTGYGVAEYLIRKH
ncbi:MAG: hypothetical protein LUP94_01665 [Candidatus Methanomethylicus sp.]|nr:hypothetical protein [Candidatus Methanomethylicus sp.]